MSGHDWDPFEKMLLEQRREIVKRLSDLESDWQDLSDRDIEREEEAQKADLTTTFEHLDQRERQEVADIDRALTKIEAGTYGTCEKCGKKISLKRLNALPATPFCRKCVC